MDLQAILRNLHGTSLLFGGRLGLSIKYDKKYQIYFLSIYDQKTQTWICRNDWIHEKDIDHNRIVLFLFMVDPKYSLFKSEEIFQKSIAIRRKKLPVIETIHIILNPAGSLEMYCIGKHIPHRLSLESI